MKFRNMKIIGILFLVLINLFGAQPAFAADPLDLLYGQNTDKYYNSVIIVEVPKFNKLLDQPAYNSARTSAKYKAWVKKVNSSSSKISAAYSKLAALTAGPSFSKSDVLLKTYSASSLDFYATYKKALAKKKSMAADITVLNGLSGKATADQDAWLSSYEQESRVADLSAPTTAPSVEFISEGPTLLQAVLVGTNNFNQKSLRITSYKYEWYMGVNTETPALVGTTEVKDIEGIYAWTIEDAEIGIFYSFRVQASNEFGSGPWSAKFTILKR